VLIWNSSVIGAHNLFLTRETKSSFVRKKTGNAIKAAVAGSQLKSSTLVLLLISPWVFEVYSNCPKPPRDKWLVVCNIKITGFTPRHVVFSKLKTNPFSFFFFFYYSSQTVDVEENETISAVNQNLKVNKLKCNVVPLFGRVVIYIILNGFIFTFFLWVPNVKYILYLFDRLLIKNSSNVQLLLLWNTWRSF